MMTYWTQDRLAGLLLILGLLVGIAAGVVIVSSGVDFGRLLNPGLEGLEEVGKFQSVYRLSLQMGAAGIILSLLGLSMLTGLIRQAGDPTWADLGLSAFTVSAILFLVDLAFHIGVAISVAQTVLDSGVFPEIYPALRTWASRLQSVSITAGLLAMVGYGGGILRTRYLPRTLGYVCIGWGAGLLFIRLISYGMPVGIIAIMPAILGVSLLLRRSDSAEPGA